MPWHLIVPQSAIGVFGSSSCTTSCRPGSTRSPPFSSANLPVGQVLRGARVPGIVRDLALAVVVAERDVIEICGEDRAVELVLGDGREALVFYLRSRGRGSRARWCGRGRFHLVKGRAVILRPEHVGDEVEDRVADFHLLVPEFVGRRDRDVVSEDFERARCVPGLDHAVVAGDYHEGDSVRVEAFECFEHGRVGLGLRFDRVEEVARVDEGVGLLWMISSIADEEIVVDLLLAEVHAAFRVQPAEGRETEMGVGDVDEFHCVMIVCWGVLGYKGVGGGGETKNGLSVRILF